MRNSLNSRSGNRMKAKEIGQYLEIHPGICFGRLIFKGTRVPVETVLAFVADGLSINVVEKHWPGVSQQAAAEAVHLAAMALVDLTGARPWKPEQDLPRPWQKRRLRTKSNKARVG